MNRKTVFQKQKPFGAGDQLGYYFGDVGGTLINGFADAYYMVFCTYVLGLSPFFTGTMFFFAKVWDAVSGPVIGSLPDRFRLPAWLGGGRNEGRFHPWIRLAVLPLALSGILCFSDVSALPETARKIWASAAYLLYGTAYSGTSMPYGAMASVISRDPGDRAKLSRARAAGGMTVSTVVMALVPRAVFDGAGHYRASAFLALALAFAVGSVLSYWLCLRLTTERDEAPEKEKNSYSYRRVVADTLRNRPLLGVMLASAGIMLYFTGSGQLTSLVFKEYYHVPWLASLVSFSNLPVMLVLFPLAPWLSRRFGKKNVVLAGFCWTGAAAAAMLLFPMEHPGVFLAAVILGNTGLQFFQMLVWAMVTDCIDVQEARTGRRSDGSVYSLYTLSRKLGSALAASSISYILGVMGMVSGAASQTAQVAGGIRTLFAACYFTVFLLGAAGSLLYGRTMGEKG